MIDFGQMLALGVKMEEPNDPARGGGSPKEWNTLPGTFLSLFNNKYDFFNSFY